MNILKKKEEKKINLDNLKLTLTSKILLDLDVPKLSAVTRTTS